MQQDRRLGRTDWQSERGLDFLLVPMCNKLVKREGTRNCDYIVKVLLRPCAKVKKLRGGKIKVIVVWL